MTCPGQRSISVSEATYLALEKRAGGVPVSRLAEAEIVAALASPGDLVERVRAAMAIAKLRGPLASSHGPRPVSWMKISKALYVRIDERVRGTGLWRRGVLERAIHAALDAEGAR